MKQFYWLIPNSFLIILAYYLIAFEFYASMVGKIKGLFRITVSSQKLREDIGTMGDSFLKVANSATAGLPHFIERRISLKIHLRTAP